MATHAKSNQGITSAAELGVTLSSVCALTPPQRSDRDRSICRRSLQIPQPWQEWFERRHSP
eukprot:3820780-Pleurochrysis_carterae.AAC.1